MFNFQYEDGAKMVSVGGVVYDAGQRPIVAKCSFEDLFFVRVDDKAHPISVSSLTHREIGRFLNQQLPAVLGGAGLVGDGIPPEHLKQYAEVYRFAPFYVDADL